MKRKEQQTSLLPKFTATDIRMGPESRMQPKKFIHFHILLQKVLIEYELFTQTNNTSSVHHEARACNELMPNLEQINFSYRKRRHLPSGLLQKSEEVNKQKRIIKIYAINWQNLDEWSQGRIGREEEQIWGQRRCWDGDWGWWRRETGPEGLSGRRGREKQRVRVWEYFPFFCLKFKI